MHSFPTRLEGIFERATATRDPAEEEEVVKRGTGNVLDPERHLAVLHIGAKQQPRIAGTFWSVTRRVSLNPDCAIGNYQVERTGSCA
jgi:hypothetical protein